VINLFQMSFDALIVFLILAAMTVLWFFIFDVPRIIPDPPYAYRKIGIVPLSHHIPEFFALLSSGCL